MNQQIVVNNNLISYFKANTGTEKPAIIFLHGWRSSKEVWQGVLGKLQQAGCSIYTLDLPGFGSSPAPKSDFTVSDYASLVAEFIKKQNLGRVVLVGHSFGGRIGIKLAATAPETVAKLVLADSAGFAMESRKKSGYGLAARLVKPFFKPAFMQGLRKRVYKLIGAEDYLTTPSLQKTFVNAVSEDLTGDMKRVSCPTLIIFGEKDADTPKEFGSRMHSLIVNSRLEILEGAGHYSFLDKPEEFAQLLTKFVSQ